jgi:hypothetical protein
MRLTKPQKKVLWNIWNGLSPTHHCQGRYDFYLAERAKTNLYERSLITKNDLGGMFLTDAGRKLIDEAGMLG